VSWQIIPSALGKFLNHPDPAKVQNTMNTMLQMGKIDIAGLEQAAA
jgi:predicted 3-demethylubiquinone-9 3-methyltransferase (glyoxalase superfamily)